MTEEPTAESDVPLAEEIRRELVCSCIEEAALGLGKPHPFCRGAELAARLAETRVTPPVDGDGVMICCDAMADHLNRVCSIHEDPWDCPDAAVVTTQNGLGLLVRDGSRSYLVISFCPWCGTNVTSPGG